MPKRFALRKAGAYPITYLYSLGASDDHVVTTARKEEAMTFDSHEEAEKAKNILSLKNFVVFLLTA